MTRPGWTRIAPGLWRHEDGRTLERQTLQPCAWWLWDDDDPEMAPYGPWPSLDAAIEAVGRG